MENQAARRRSVSLFSNCGAGDLGYRNAGFTFDVMAELDPRRLEVCLLNHPEAIGIHGDLRDTWQEVVTNYRQIAGEERPALLAACPPCQGMSSARGNRGKADDADAGSKDGRNLLVVVIAKVAEALEPDLVVVENVPAFLTRKVRHPQTNEPISAANLLIALLNVNYQVFPVLTNLCDYGVPQTRKRAFLTFVRRNLEGLQCLLRENLSPYPRPTHAEDYGGPGPITLRQALTSFKLPVLDAKSAETAHVANGNDLHFVPIWLDRRYDMVEAIPINSGASAWENQLCLSCGTVKVQENDAICPSCGAPLLRPVVQEPSGTYRLVDGFRTSSYRRMHPDKPAPTITTASGHIGSNITIHPYENRVLSALECAYLQTFPQTFRWGDALAKWGHTNIRAMIGEAVPPNFTLLHGTALTGVIANKLRSAPLSSSDQRCLTAWEKLRQA